MPNTIFINGIRITSSGNIAIRNNKVIVDGQDVTPDAKEINISITGNVDRLEADVCSRISVTGDTGNIKTMSGDVEVRGEIKGSVQTMSGDVDCNGSIGGSVTTMSGDIKRR